jgi:hypothetical protein
LQLLDSRYGNFWEAVVAPNNPYGITPSDDNEFHLKALMVRTMSTFSELLEPVEQVERSTTDGVVVETITFNLFFEILSAQSYSWFQGDQVTDFAYGAVRQDMDDRSTALAVTYGGDGWWNASAGAGADNSQFYYEPIGLRVLYQLIPSNPQVSSLSLSLSLPAELSLSLSRSQSVLGWKYHQAFEESQKYKEGKFIIERQQVRKVRRGFSSAVCLAARTVSGAARTCA